MLFFFQNMVLVENIVSRSTNTESATRGVLINFAKFTGKHLYQSLFINKVACLRPTNLFKKGLWHRCCPVNFVKSLRTLFLQNTSGGLLLQTGNTHMKCVKCI